METKREQEAQGAALLAVEGVGKHYRGGFWGLREATLQLGPGILGLVGPNGAGKSTLMRIVATITKPTEGRVLWEGEDAARDPDRLRSALGYLPQDFGVYPNLNAREFLSYVAALKGVEGKAARRRIDDLLEVLNLAHAARRPLGGYSGGMKQRVGIAQALLNDPKILIVDEPTVGLDPEERARFRYLLTDLAEERVVILSTHIVSDVEATAETIAVMNGGRILTHTTPEDLLAGVEGRVWTWTVPAAELSDVRRHFLVSGTLRRRDGVVVRAVAEDGPHPQATPARPTLEDAYLRAIEADKASHAGANDGTDAGASAPADAGGVR